MLRQDRLTIACIRSGLHLPVIGCPAHHAPVAQCAVTYRTFESRVIGRCCGLVMLSGCVSTVAGTAVRAKDAMLVDVLATGRGDARRRDAAHRRTQRRSSAPPRWRSPRPEEMTDHSGEVSDPDCLGAIYGAEEPVVRRNRVDRDARPGGPRTRRRQRPLGRSRPRCSSRRREGTGVLRGFEVAAWQTAAHGDPIIGRGVTTSTYLWDDRRR